MFRFLKAEELSLSSLHAIPVRPVFGLIQLLSNRLFLTGFILAGKPFRLPFGDPPT